MARKQTKGKRNQSQTREETGMLSSWKPNKGSQSSFVNAIKHTEGDVLSLGAAGVGKSFLAINSAMDAYEDGVIDQIILCRPAKGPCETLGFTKGSTIDKMSGWVMPMINIMYKRYGFRNKGIVDSMVERGDIVLQPLDQIMGMDIADAWLICDEVQGVNTATMKSLVTRVNETGKLIMIGDTRQELLKKDCGVNWLLDKLERFEGFGFTYIEFNMDDCVRSGRVRQRLYDMQSDNEY